MKTLSPLGVLSSQVATGNLVWVDAVNGNDALAVRGRMTVPFKTLVAAKQAAKAPGSGETGDTIIVMPGIYTERNLLKHGVNWHFLPGAKVVVTGGGPGAIFDTSSYGTGGSVSCIISGYGEFDISSATDATASVINSAVAGSELILQARSLSGGNLAPTVKVTAGMVRLEVMDYIYSRLSIPLQVLGSGACVACARTIFSSGGLCVYYAGASLIVRAHTVQSTGDYSAGTVHVDGGSGSVLIDAYEILGANTSAYCVVCYSNPSATITIKGARIKVTGSSSPARAVYVSANAPGKVKLINCVLLVNSSAPDSIYAAYSNTVVQMHGLTVANKANNANVIAKPTSGFDATGYSYID
jgi:hypothetical protein